MYFPRPLYYSAFWIIGSRIVLQPWLGSLPKFNGFPENLIEIHLRGCRSKKSTFLKNWRPVRGPMSFAAKEKNTNKIKWLNPRQTNTSHCPTKTISKSDLHPLKSFRVILLTDRQTDKQTNKQTNQRYQKHSLLVRGNDLIITWSISITSISQELIGKDIGLLGPPFSLINFYFLLYLLLFYLFILFFLWRLDTQIFYGGGPVSSKYPQWTYL